jgi:beta-1,4-mannosyltransferase
MRVVARPAFSNRLRNPYNWLLYTHLRDLGVEVVEWDPAGTWPSDVDILHLHWPDARLKADSWLRAAKQVMSQDATIRRARARGTRVIWTMHNLDAHEQAYPWLERLFWWRFVPQVDGYISLTASGKDQGRRRFPSLSEVPGFVVPHGHYRGQYPNDTDRLEARTRLGIAPDATVLAFAGLIRSYKNVPRLIRAFSAVDAGDAVLLVAGQVEWPETEESVRRAAVTDARVRLNLQFVADADLQLYLNAADVVVLPFSEVFNSGSALLALSFDRPVLVPDTPTMRELQMALGIEWVRTVDAGSDAAVIQNAIQWARQSRAGRAPLDAFSWRAISEATLNVYKQIVSG